MADNQVLVDSYLIDIIAIRRSILAEMTKGLLVNSSHWKGR